MWISVIQRMRLLTHNMLTSPVKGVQPGCTFIIQATETKEVDVDFSPEFITRMIPRLEWDALVKALEMVGKPDMLPAQPTSEYEKEEEFLKKVHHAIMEIEVISGHLKCPESGRLFPITKGIPNMLLNEDELNGYPTDTNFAIRHISWKDIVRSMACGGLSQINTILGGDVLQYFRSNVDLHSVLNFNIRNAGLGMNLNF